MSFLDPFDFGRIAGGKQGEKPLNHWIRLRARVHLTEKQSGFGGKMFPRIKKIAYAAALSAGLSLLIPTGAIAQDQDHHDQQSQDQDHHGQQSEDQDHHGQQLQDQHRDWSNNRNYQIGAREGSKDHKSNQRKTHNHKFDNDDDRRAYQAGYDSAWQGNQNSGHDEDRPH